MLQIKSKHEVKEATLHQTVSTNAFCIDEGADMKNASGIGCRQLDINHSKIVPSKNISSLLLKIR